MGSLPPKSPRPQVPLAMGTRTGKESGMVTEANKIIEHVKTSA